MKTLLMDNRHVVIATVVLSPLVVGLLALGSLTLRETRAATPHENGIKAKFINTSQRVSLCLNGKPLY